MVEFILGSQGKKKTSKGSGLCLGDNVDLMKEFSHKNMVIFER